MKNKNIRKSDCSKNCSPSGSHYPDVEVEIDELLESIWELRESGKVTENHMKGCGAGRVILEKLSNLVEMSLIQFQGGHIKFTSEGEERAKNIVRRHRLTERMLTDLFEIPEGRIEGTSCEFEHILSEEVTDSICAFLGHPTNCPHGKSIPPGECCHKLIKTIKPLVIPLIDLNPGEKGRIVFISSKDRRRLQKLASLGITPDGDVVVNQKLPVVVVQVSETEIALDRGLASEIYVKRIKL